MSTPQHSPNALSQSDENIVIPQAEPLTLAQRTFIDYRAINGLVVNDDGVRKMTLIELAQNLNVDRKTLNNWQRTIPGFWELVAIRRKELATQNRLAKMHEVWELKAMKGDWQFWNAWQLNFNQDYRAPTQKVEHDLGDSWAALIRNKKQLIEGEATSAETTDQPSGLPEAS